jgi:hypothetical protein
VYWKQIVKEKDWGGLSVGSLIEKKKGMLFKWLWKLGEPHT